MVEVYEKSQLQQQIWIGGTTSCYVSFRWNCFHLSLSLHYSFAHHQIIYKASYLMKIKPILEVALIITNIIPLSKWDEENHH